MKKLRSFALYALVTPVIALGTGSLLADQTTDQDADREQQSTQSDQEATKSSETADQDVGEATKSSETADQDVGEATQSSENADQDVGEAYDGENVDEATQASESSDQDVDHEQQSTQSDQDATQSTTKTTQSDQNTGDQSGMQNRGYMESAPANGMQASNLIGAEVKTSADENVGSVSDLIIDENGQVVAIVIGVGGFLGMGEKDIAIGWDDVTRSGDSDEQELRIDLTREDLSSAPEFKTLD